MEAVRLVVGVVLPYAAVLVFILGMIYRIYTWKKLKQPPMTLYPAPSSNAANTVKEVVFFKSLFHGDKLLWFFAWGFHVVLALVFVGHFRVFTNADKLLMKMGMSADGIQAMSGSVGGAAGVVLLATALFLFARRLVVGRAREISGPSDYLILALLGAIIITGDMMRFGSEHVDLGMTREYFAGLATFSAVTDMPILKNGLFLVHMGLAFLLVVLIPFSKILHFGGIFFTHQLVRKH